MSAADLQLRPAKIDDAADLARFIDYAGEGLPSYLWQKLVEPGETPLDVGRRRAARDEGGFSYRNATMAEFDGRVGGGLIGYRLGDEPEAIEYDDMPAMFVPLQELENLAPGTWYINAIASLPDMRGRGIGSALLEAAGTFAVETASRGLSLIVSDGNEGAVKLYLRSGYDQRASRPMVKEDWQNAGENWLLMTKSL
ncbi:MAG: GNAT family N-acetyltransferase [Rhodospirillaceae bacterium]|jgi:ribosomal protein S18 acetylase RimI-like enzyme|nr:GNAT family N-acetyltransferase [Rhodospirillaceae bacterium]MBT4487420.1 GNAT family N-acetyltransferase [Rhodospirillaceae bacterium]MBT5193566.1 GNAT family N-acetyltransferase [Rhodospirillaceae bacterium]MBT5895473.1 GNAT family N-acetyltransferase [Rhodospirillaceae bacterium]MBT6429404.1 GNAT family N-acetyltransferase [Rhodospirillaceae bacterium]